MVKEEMNWKGRKIKLSQVRRLRWYENKEDRSPKREKQKAAY